MERTPELFDMIEAYLNDTLSVEQKEAFEQQMQADKALAKEVAQHREMQSALSDKKTLDFREKIQKIRTEMLASEEDADKEVVTLTPEKAPNFPYWKLAVAAVFVIGLGVLVWDNGTTDSNKDLYAMYYKPFPVDDTTRGEGKEELSAIYKSYKGGAYEKVIPALEKHLITSEKQKLRLYLGNSYLGTDQAKKAAQQFRKVTEKSMFYEDAQWYLALTYLKLQVEDSTKYFLKNVLDYKGIHEQKAKKLLEKL